MTGLAIFAVLLSAVIAFAVYPPAGYVSLVIVAVLVSFAGDTGG